MAFCLGFKRCKNSKAGRTRRAALQERLLQDLLPPHALVKGARMQKIEEAIQVLQASAERRPRHTPPDVQHSNHCTHVLLKVLTLESI